MLASLLSKLYLVFNLYLPSLTAMYQTAPHTSDVYFTFLF